MQAHRQKYSMHCPMPSLASQTEWVLCVVKLSHVELFTQSAHSAGPWSIKHKGNCWDNAVAENLFATLKKGKIRGETFATREQARSVVFQYIECYYNLVRSHSSNGWVSPANYERLQQPTIEATPVPSND